MSGKDGEVKASLQTTVTIDPLGAEGYLQAYAVAGTLAGLVVLASCLSLLLPVGDPVEDVLGRGVTGWCVRSVTSGCSHLVQLAEVLGCDRSLRASLWCSTAQGSKFVGSLDPRCVF